MAPELRPGVFPMTVRVVEPRQKSSTGWRVLQIPQPGRQILEDAAMKRVLEKRVLDGKLPVPMRKVS